MKTITQYRDEIKALKKAAGDISAKATAENRDPKPEEVSLKNEILDKIEDLERIVLAQEREERINARLDAPLAAPVTKPGPTMDGPKDRPKDRFATLGEQMVAVAASGRPGGRTDPRLFTAAAASGLNETVPSDGGFLVQQDFVNDLLQDLIQTGVLAQRCRRQQVSANANSMKINGVDETSRASTRFGGIVGYWADEAELKTASKPKFRKIELNLHKLIGLCYATDELMADAAALESFIRSAFPSEFGFLVDDAIINGTGAGQPLGVLNSGCLVSVTAETGQKAATIV